MKDLITEIKQVMVEELGVSKEVAKTANNILQQIIKDSHTIPYSDRKSNSFNYNLMDNIITVHYELSYVDNEEDIVLNNRIGYSKKIKDKEYFLSTNLWYIKNENRYIDFEGTIQHEVEHIYQMIRSNTTLLDNEKSENIYKIAEYLRNNRDVWYKLVGYAVYYNNKFEKDAFVNGIYNSIVNNPQKSPYDMLKKSATYSNIMTIKKYVLDTDFYKNKFEEIVIISFNKEYKWFYNLCNKVVKTYINKIGKVFAKAQKDLYGEGKVLDGGILLGGNEIINIDD